MDLGMRLPRIIRVGPICKSREVLAEVRVMVGKKGKIQSMRGT